VTSGDILTGTGNDTIWGNEGSDTMAGGTGADRYVFLAGSGNDRIVGFDAAEGDRLDLAGQAFAIGTAADGSALITLSGGGTITLASVAPASLSPTFIV
jgi:Ca2+-binding RTX toxin-like protein